jgi:DNA-binding CsgD family transcriptional regulator/tetratricopeptide (TPR) repeat protein
MPLLEREACFSALNASLAEVVAGTGRVVLIGGEAGLGKTSLVEAFTQTQRNRVRIWWGACEALFTPRPLGPLHDIAAQMPRDLLAHLDVTSDRAALFAAFLAELQNETTLVVVEDVHWADEATLDLLKFLGRRIQQTCALLIVTYRDDELGPQHPLRTVLGDLVAVNATRRITLSPLSVKAVQVLIGDRAWTAAALHQQTSGNPFFLTEILAGESGSVPVTISDAVLARAARLSPSARAVLDAAAIIGTRVEPWLLTAVTGAEAYAAEQCLTVGVLRVQGDNLIFRHELARQIIIEAIAPHRRSVLHRLVLDALRSSLLARTNLARLAHHAEAIGDHDAVLEYAPAAARQASAVSAHRAAAALYALALRYDDRSSADQALLLEAHAWECNLIGQPVEAIASRRHAIELWREVDNPLKQGENLALLALLLLEIEHWIEAEEAGSSAIQVLETLSPGRELALAYRTKALLHHNRHEYADVIVLAEKAAMLAEQLGDARVLAMAYDTLGTTWLTLDYERGQQVLERCLTVAREAGLHARIASVYGNLGSTSCEFYRFSDAARYLAEGIAFTAERDLDLIRLYMRAWQALMAVHVGRWDEAADAANEVLHWPGVSSNSRITALIALGRVRARRGDVDPAEVLAEASKLAAQSGFFHHVAPVRATWAEAAWLSGDRQRTLEEVLAAYDLAMSKQHPWFAGELAFWRWRAGNRFTPPAWIARPFALHIAGQWQAAAEEWKRLGCPYEQARALADGDTSAQMAALAIFERLDAKPAIDEVRQQLRAAGVRNLPRSTTRENPYGLTARQMDILTLLADDLTNAEIAARLHVSPKTVDHHVSAVLAKLDVHSREEAAQVARRDGLVK